MTDTLFCDGCPRRKTEMLPNIVNLLDHEEILCKRCAIVNKTITVLEPMPHDINLFDLHCPICQWEAVNQSLPYYYENPDWLSFPDKQPEKK